MKGIGLLLAQRIDKGLFFEFASDVDGSELIITAEGDRSLFALVEVNAHDVEYHDVEWGVPSFDDRHLFEMLTLEGAQAGLSWTTILKKRESYRRAFGQFDATKVARYDKRRIAHAGGRYGQRSRSRCSRHSELAQRGK